MTKRVHLPSSSNIFNVVLKGLPRIILLGKESEVMMKSTLSLPSNKESLFIETLNFLYVSSAINVTLYGPMP